MKYFWDTSFKQECDISIKFVVLKNVILYDSFSRFGKLAGIKNSGQGKGPLYIVIGLFWGGGGPSGNFPLYRFPPAPIRPGFESLVDTEN